MFANTDGLELVEHFEVSWKDLYAVHATISFTLNLEQLDEKKRVVHRAESFYERFADMVRGEFGYRRHSGRKRGIVGTNFWGKRTST